GWPLYQLGRGLRQRGRLLEMKLWRVLRTISLAGILAATFFYLPLPISRVRQVGLVQVQPEALEKVFLQTPGVLEKLHVRNGQRVEKGELLAEFRNPELESLRDDLRTNLEICEVRRQTLQVQAASAIDPREQARIEAALAATAGEHAALARQA